MSRTLFIGDIQGCRPELERLLERVAFDPARDRLHPVGDLVNRGPDSLGTLRLLLDLGALPVLGNHDVHLLRVARGLRELGKGDTLDEILAAPDRDALLDWLAGRPFALGGDDWLLVHAGLRADWSDPLAVLEGLDPHAPAEEIDFATRVRTCKANGEMPRGGESEGYAPWFEHYRDRQDRTVVFGHWAARGLVAEPGFRGLDTGCVWGGRLTAWILEEDRFVDVPAERTYCEPASDDSRGA